MSKIQLRTNRGVLTMESGDMTPLCGCPCARHYEVKRWGCQCEASERTNGCTVVLDGRRMLMCGSCADAWVRLSRRRVET